MGISAYDVTVLMLKMEASIYIPEFTLFYDETVRSQFRHVMMKSLNNLSMNGLDKMRTVLKHFSYIQILLQK